MLAQDVQAEFKANPHYIWCADVQSETKDMLYVDHAHYNARGAKLLSECIQDALIARDLIQKQTQQAAATH